MVMPFNNNQPQRTLTPYEQWLQSQPQYQAIQPNGPGEAYQGAAQPQWAPNFGRQGTPFQPNGAGAAYQGPNAPQWVPNFHGGTPFQPVTGTAPQAPMGGAGVAYQGAAQPQMPGSMRFDSGKNGPSFNPSFGSFQLETNTGPGGPPPTTPGGLDAGAAQGGAPNGQTATNSTPPAWTARTAGKTGDSYYNVLAGKFDPWGNWGKYGPALNAPKRHQTAQGMESDTDRVYRWTNDILRSMGYAGGENAPVELRTRIFLANVERLKQDYQNLNLDWNTSAFANMDQQVRLTVASGGSGGGTMPGTGTGGTTPGTGGGTGGGGAAPGTTPTTNTGGTGSGLNAAQAGVLSRDPALAYRYMMQQLGYDPSAPGLLGKFLKQQFQPLLEARMAAANVSDDASYLDTLDNTIKDFGSGLFQKGGNFYGNLANIGNQAAQQGAGYLNQLKDQEQAQQYLQQLGMLRYAGTNPLIQQAMADEMRRANETYQDLSFNTEAGQSKNIDPFQQWLLGQSRYRSIFGY